MKLLIGEINEDLYKTFSEGFKPNGQHVIELCSTGGDMGLAFALASKVQQSTIYVYGQCMSAATLILAAAKHRVMHENACVMVHEAKDDVEGTVHDLRVRALQLQKDEDKWNRLMEAYTGTPALKWEQLSKATTYLTAQQCLELGLIDEIIKGENNA